jgi:hypothetical protein
LEKQVKEADELAAKAGEKEKSAREEKAKELRHHLQKNMEQHARLFKELIANAPEQARPSLQAAFEATMKGYQTSLEAAGTDPESIKKGGFSLDLKTTLAVRGTLESVDVATATLVVTTDSGRLTLKITEKTAYQSGKGPGTVTAADLKAGSTVKVEYNKETLEVLRIDTTGEASGKTGKAPA